MCETFKKVVTTRTRQTKWFLIVFKDEEVEEEEQKMNSTDANTNNTITNTNASNENELKRICVFCGSSIGKNNAYKTKASELGALMASEQIQLTYGGGNIGLMGIVAEAAYADGRNKVLGVIPEGLCAKEISGKTVGEQIIVKDMHERKKLMADNSDGFIALPGGFGTLEELMEVITWQQLGYHCKPIGLLNVNGYFDSLLKFLELATEEGFISDAARRIVLFSVCPRDLIEQMRRYTITHAQVVKEFKG